jgi:hypothetical protein
MLRFLLFCFIPCYLRAVSALYLTWYDDPTTTMAIQWHTFGIDAPDRIDLRLEEEGEWKVFEGSHTALDAVRIHAVFLEGLEPNTRYQFRVDGESSIYTFQTAPKELTAPIQFVVGGDAMQSIFRFQKMNRVIAAHNPLFCVIGGDIAYAIHPDPIKVRVKAINRWLEFLALWKKQMIAPDGRIIPFVLAIGNHDIVREQPDLFFTLFAFPQRRLYRTIDFGTYLTLILLDTNHFEPILGDQTTWLEKVLLERTGWTYRFPIYHVAAYPSFYSFQSVTARQIRQTWCPLFEKYGIRVAFENHNHTYKRTWPMKKGEIDPAGVLYLGDGSWGVRPRKTEARWYLQKAVSQNSVYLVTLNPEVAQIQALDLEGKIFDQIEVPTQRPKTLLQTQALLP